MLKKRFLLSLLGGLCLASVMSAPQAAHAIMTYGNDNNNLIAPTGEYASVGYNYMGRVLGPVSPEYPTGTGNPVIPISDHWALQANHIGANPGDVIDFGGSLHTILERQRVGTSDLSLVRVDSAFSSYAYMYDPTQDGVSEVLRDSVIVGATHAQKDVNAPIITNTPGTGAPLMNGWGVKGVPESEKEILTWGRNRVESVVPDVLGTEVLYSTFDRPTLDDGSPNPAYIGADEAAAYSGDSGGGMFIQQNGQWRIAGQIYAVDAVSSTNGGQYSVLGPIYDARNMWSQDENGNWYQIEDSNPVPLGMYASRISSYRSMIDSITGETRGLGAFTVVPEAGTAPLMLGAMGIVLGAVQLRRRRK